MQTNRMWVTLTFIYAMQSHHISPHDQQLVSDTDIYFMPCSLITSHPMTNSMWVTLTFIYAMQSHHISPHDQQGVSDTNIYAIPCSLITSHLTPWPTGCEWHWHLFMPCSLITQQHVSDTDIYLCHAVSSHLTPWPTGCEWHWHLFMPCSLITSHPMTNSEWVTLTFIYAMQSHHISPHDQQLVSDTDIYLCHAVSSHLTMTNSLWVTLHYILFLSWLWYLDYSKISIVLWLLQLLASH